MRIIRGKFKGKKISVPKGFKDRPTTDFAKEALFNILSSNYDIENVAVLDLFAGSGNISLEFLSEGCGMLTAVDKNRKYVYHLKKITEELFPGQADIVIADVFSFCENQNMEYDIIFADPPYDDKKTEILPDKIFENPTIKENTLFILEHSKRNDFSEHPFFKETRKYGNVRFTFFQKK